jgi:hypothetical protein
MPTTKGATKKKTAVASNDSARDGAQGLPVFFKNPQILDFAKHATASVAAHDNYRFAQTTNSIPLSIGEFAEACKSYPIIFAGEQQVLPAAITGLELDNYFVNKDGEWLTPNYIPAHARQYPFILFEDEKNDRVYLCVDEASSQFHAKKTKDAAPLYDANGEPSELGKKAMEFCSSFYQQNFITRQFCNDLVKYHLLTPFASQATLNSGRVLHVSGFQMIDEEAFNGLTDVAYLDLRKKGWLPAIHFALASVSNWKRLVEMAPQ